MTSTCNCLMEGGKCTLWGPCTYEGTLPIMIPPCKLRGLLYRFHVPIETQEKGDNSQTQGTEIGLTPV